MRDSDVDQALTEAVHDDARVFVSSSVVTDGIGAGSRVIDVHPWGGLHCRILPDRGLDIGPVWFGGRPVDWRSSVGFASPSWAASQSWLTAFGGGLLVTCGPDNVGPDCEVDGVTYGMHGSHSRTPAEHVRTHVNREAGVVEVTGSIRHTTVFGAHLVVDRTIHVSLDSAEITVRDVVTNRGRAPEPLLWLYHLNLGQPLVSPEVTMTFPDGEVIPRDQLSEAAVEDYSTMPAPYDGAPPQVLEHRLSGSGSRRVELRNESAGMQATVTVEGDELPRLWQWRNATPDAYLVGVEPANCGVLGRAIELENGAVDIVKPGDHRRFGFRIELQS